MAKTTVEHLSLTVSEVETFIETIQLINNHNLWDDAKNFLADNGKTEMFIDGEVFHLFSKMLKDHACYDPNDPTQIKVLDHQGRFADYFDDLDE